MPDYDSVDFFTDESLLEDPYPYFDHLRSQCPVLPTAHHGVVAVSGYEEASEIYLEQRGLLLVQLGDRPLRDVPGAPRGRRRGCDHRPLPRPAADERAHGDDGPARRTRSERSLIMRLLTPKRLKENEAFMWRLADRQIDEFVARRPLRVHPRLHPALRHARRGRRPRRARGRPPALPRGFRVERVTGQDRRGRQGHDAATRSEWLDDWFAAYIEDRRREPRDDVLTDLALGDVPRRLDARRRPPSCARRRSSSPPARRRRPASWPSG